ncbi:MAG: CRISPR-associated endoribonuclease Cas6 [Elainella sp. Prado103]|jgi:CRISPR-associated endoribonuclease Cas6|nr:CRISPR-associated endoribonuclease Cas6 [Elainella sp. Prado103]
MPPRRLPSSSPPWSASTELVGVELSLSPLRDCRLYPEYAIGLHAWFLDQVRQNNPELSAFLHDDPAKPFTLSRLVGLPFAHTLTALAHETYYWTITALNQPVCQWLAEWWLNRPAQLELRGAAMQIVDAKVIYPPTTYVDLLNNSISSTALSFCSPTSFRHRGHHLPLPLPKTLFQSYLRRWNDFSGEVVDSEDFLDWIDEFVVIARHQIESLKVTAGKRGSVTGFVGSVEFHLLPLGQRETEYAELFGALVQLAPYCGTGHKTTFGLGQTRVGWLTAAPDPIPPIERLAAQRITELTELFLALKKRQGGHRAINSAETWATILARRELGESLKVIAVDLGIPYETVKTYLKLARKALNDTQAEDGKMIHKD